MSGYGLGDFLGEVAAPTHVLTIRLQNGRGLRLPWALEDLRLVKPEEINAFEKKLAKSFEFSPAELQEAAEIFSTFDSIDPASFQLHGFVGDSYRVTKDITKGIGKGIKNVAKKIGKLFGLNKKEKMLAKIAAAKALMESVGLDWDTRAQMHILALQRRMVPAINHQSVAALATAGMSGPQMLAWIQGKAPIPAGVTLPDTLRRFIEARPDLSDLLRVEGGGAVARNDFVAPDVRKPGAGAVEIAPGAPAALPEVKSKFTRNLALGVGAAGAVGVAGAYAMTRR